MSIERKIYWTMVIYLAIILFIGILASCKTKYVAVPEVHTEYVNRTDSVYLRDSIYQRDSVIMYMQGDTMFKTIYLNKYVFRDRWRTKVDSFIKVDSISVPYPVERKLTYWEQTRLRLFFPLVFLCVVVTTMMIWLFKRKG